MSAWSVYMVRCRDDSIYTGIAIDLEKRIAKHNAGEGAKYTRSRLPVVLMWEESVESESAARVREAVIKRYSRQEKEVLVAEYK